MKIIHLFFCLLTFNVFSQSNIRFTHPDVLNVLQGNYNPTTYQASNVIHDRSTMVTGILNDVDADSLKSTLVKLETFYTRNTGSDTLSASTGIGAARTWIHQKFQEYGSNNENRLLVGYLQFDVSACGQTRHKNVAAILPGSDLSREEIVLVEAHYDSRCEQSCDTGCYAPGMEDNGSGTALVMELARVMAKYTFDRTIIFTVTTGEEQGLLGGEAWSDYIDDNNIPFLACLNNDVIGGIICGENSSPPSCNTPGALDSTNVRIFSFSQVNDSARNSSHKQLARYVKLQQIEEINPNLTVPMELNLMIMEDRTGRGGDHKPFRQNGFRAIRFTSQHEFGDGSGNAIDRQHTVNDVLGIDTDIPPDGQIDDYYVNFEYLKRNAIMNGINLGLMALSPRVPEPIYEEQGTNFNLQRIVFEDEDTLYDHRVGLRYRGSGHLYFDTVISSTNRNYIDIPVVTSTNEYYVSVCNVENGTESMFADEYSQFYVGIDELPPDASIVLFANYPNPFVDFTDIKFDSQRDFYEQSYLQITDLSGRIVEQIKIGRILKGENVIRLNRGNLQAGFYYYTLFVDDQVLGTRPFILAEKK